MLFQIICINLFWICFSNSQNSEDQNDYFLYSDEGFKSKQLAEDLPNKDIELVRNEEDDRVFNTHFIRSGVEVRTALRDRKRLWKNGIIPYTLSKKFGPEECARIVEAAEEFQKYTCVFFTPRSDERNYLYIEPGKGCESDIGKNKYDAQTSSQLSRACFFNKPGVLLHEMMHILGFVHEHQRLDRDEYVMIIEENIMSGKKLQFEKFTWEKVTSFNFTYDYDSVMHYGPYVFSKDQSSATLPTIIPLKEGVQIGQRDGFSEVDIQKINLLYNC